MSLYSVGRTDGVVVEGGFGHTQVSFRVRVGVVEGGFGHTEVRFNPQISNIDWVLLVLNQ